ncbi:MAG: hypothetical protein NVS4B2_23540 [Chloroflexota bacterium]
MSRQAVEELVDRWISDPTFRDEMRGEPEGTVRRTGIQLDEEEWATLRAIDWDLSNDELQSRINKDGGF